MPQNSLKTDMSFMRQLTAFLTVKPSMPLWRYCLLAFPIALLPSIALLSAVYGGLTYFDVDFERYMPPDRTANLELFFGIVIFAPIAETLLLAGMIGLLSMASSNRLFVAWAAAMLWGCMHGLAAPLWFFGTVWSFFVFSCGYMNWRERSFRQGFMVAAVPHALINFSAFMLALIDAP
jgi:membrane protease YdiL (CAAX protease family)